MWCGVYDPRSVLYGILKYCYYLMNNCRCRAIDRKDFGDEFLFLIFFFLSDRTGRINAIDQYECRMLVKRVYWRISDIDRR